MIVKKYGGSALATPEQILNIAKKIAQDYKAHPEPTIIVVSAMGQTTNELLDLGHSLSTSAPARELDMLISAGERISMAMMSIALQKQACPAISFTGSQAGILTSSKHGQAFIQDIKPIRVDAELQKNKIIVIAGFQGVDPITKEVTTLGRGGTDTTAVAFAAHYKARSCELYKDVPGILSAPPQVCPKASLIQKIHYDDLISLCYWGSKVVQHRAVELAKKFNVPLKIGSWKDHSIGTQVSKQRQKSKKETAVEEPQLENLSLFEPILTVFYNLPLGPALTDIMHTAQKLDLPFPTLVASTSAGEDECRLMLTGHEDWIGKYISALNEDKNIEKVTQDHFGVLFQGYGLENGITFMDLVEKLSAKDIKFEKVLKDSQGLIFSFPKSEKEKVVGFLKSLK